MVFYLVIEFELAEEVSISMIVFRVPEIFVREVTDFEHNYWKGYHEPESENSASKGDHIEDVVKAWIENIVQRENSQFQRTEHQGNPKTSFTSVDKEFHETV